MINCHVLLADDEPDIRDIMEAALQRDPFFVPRSCASGSEVLLAAIEWRPDIVLLDVAMPELDGPTALKRLREDKRTAVIPAVFVTGCVRKQERERLKALGAAGVIAKPFDPLSLGVELRKYVPLEGPLAPVRRGFLQRLDADARTLSACRLGLYEAASGQTLKCIYEIAHALAGVGGIYGFAGITCEAAALSEAASNGLKGRAAHGDVEIALDRLLRRIQVREG